MALWVCSCRRVVCSQVKAINNLPKSNFIITLYVAQSASFHPHSTAPNCGIKVRGRDWSRQIAAKKETDREKKMNEPANECELLLILGGGCSCRGGYVAGKEEDGCFLITARRQSGIDFEI